jgi:hypothetical protein
MSIMPEGGWGDLRQNSGSANDAALVQSKTSVFVCPKCHSDEWKAASLVYREGILISHSQTKGSAIGIAHTGFRNGQYSVGGGLYKGRTTGVSQTTLSSMASPPQNRSGLRVVLGVMVLFFSWSGIMQVTSSPSVTIFDLLIAGAFLLGFIKLQASQHKIYEQKMALYNRTRVCQRCGTFYTTP